MKLALVISLSFLPVLWVGFGTDAEPATDAWLALQGRYDRGREVFLGRGRCVECHRYLEEGSVVRGPSLDEHWRDGAALAQRLASRPRPTAYPEAVPGDAYLLESLLEPSAYLVEGFADQMPKAHGPALGLTAQDIADLLSYLNPSPDPVARQLPQLPEPESDPWAMLPAGDVDRGEERFFRPDDSSCAGCHIVRLPRLEARYPRVFWQNGGLTGPELTRLALVVDPADLLDAILQPQRRGTPGCDEGLVETQGGRLVAGTLLAQGADGVLLMGAEPSGPTYLWFDQEDVLEVTPVERTRMTPVFSELLDPQERLDILAFLRAAALESRDLGAAARPGEELGARDPCAPLYTGQWPPEARPELLQRIPGILVSTAQSTSPGTKESQHR